MVSRYYTRQMVDCHIWQTDLPSAKFEIFKISSYVRQAMQFYHVTATIHLPPLPSSYYYHYHYHYHYNHHYHY